MGNATVLVVDDDPMIVSFLEEALSDEGYDVLAALDDAALRLAHDLQPDVILLDIMMPGMDGMEVSQRLRADPATAHIPIIAMSAQDRLRFIGRRMPVNDKLPKPFELRTLYEMVARWGGEESMRRARAQDQMPMTDGTYQATLLGVSEVNRTGTMPAWNWTFAVDLPDGTTREIVQGTATNFSVTSYPRAWAEALDVDASLIRLSDDGAIGMLRSRDVDLGQFAGRRCRVAIETTWDPGGDQVTWITEVLPPLDEVAP